MGIKLINRFQENVYGITDILYVHWRPLIWKHRPNLVYWIFLIFDSLSVMS
jgi:hypothetical protein